MMLSGEFVSVQCADHAATGGFAFGGKKTELGLRLRPTIMLRICFCYIQIVFWKLKLRTCDHGRSTSHIQKTNRLYKHWTNRYIAKISSKKAKHCSTIRKTPFA